MMRVSAANLLTLRCRLHLYGDFARYFCISGEKLISKEYLHRYWIDEFLSEAKSTTQSPTEISHQSIEYLELYWFWKYDLEAQTYTCSLRPDFHGVGIVQQEDLVKHDYVVCPKGQRVNWSIGTAELGTIIDLLLKMSNEVLIAKDAPPLKGSLRDYFRSDVGGIFWELSFHGVKPQMKLLTPELAKTRKNPPFLGRSALYNEIMET